jgi:pyruvate kinase
MKEKLVQYGDQVILTAGSPFGISGTTNMIIVQNIGDVAVRGTPRQGKRIHGKVAFILSSEHPASASGKIALLPSCDDSYLPLLKGAIGIILQNHHTDLDSEKHAILVAKMLDIPLLTRADGAFGLLKEEELVTLDPQKGVVYKGFIESDEAMIPKMCLS